MPEFRTLEEADAWRSVHAPPKPGNAHRATSANQAASDREKIADSSPPTTAADHSGAAGAPEGERSPANNPRTGEGAEPFELSTDSSKDPSAAATRAAAAKALALSAKPPRKINVREFVQPGADFESLMIAQAEEIPQVAHGLFLLACSEGNPSEISAANRNWHETAKSAHAVRADFIELQEKSRTLISIDDVRDVMGTELVAARSAFLKLGERNASKANPGNPTLAQTVIDAAVDEIFRALDAALERGARELVQPKAS